MRYLKLFEQFNFNFGDCNLYAIAMHRMYNYPIYRVRGYFKEDDWEEVSDSDMEYVYDFVDCHFVVMDNNELYLDSDGEHTGIELEKSCRLSYFEYIKIESCSEKDAKLAYIGFDEYDNIDSNYLEDEINQVIDIINKKSNN